jgi:DNA-binding transcriptional LysR family regulator
MDRLLQIETFVAAVEHASFSKAARELEVTPAMIGRRVDVLEKRLGVKSLHRSTRHLTLTEDGRQYVQQCRKISAELNKMEGGIINSHDYVPTARQCPLQLRLEASMSLFTLLRSRKRILMSRYPSI